MTVPLRPLRIDELQTPHVDWACARCIWVAHLKEPTSQFYRIPRETVELIAHLSRKERLRTPLLPEVCAIGRMRNGETPSLVLEHCTVASTLHAPRGTYSRLHVLLHDSRAFEFVEQIDREARSYVRENWERCEYVQCLRTFKDHAALKIKLDDRTRVRLADGPISKYDIVVGDEVRVVVRPLTLWKTYACAGMGVVANDVVVVRERDYGSDRNATSLCA